jgi:4a-hydroxytetrahydrobiopterin dehydratase
MVRRLMPPDRTALTTAEVDAFLRAHPAWRIELGQLCATFTFETFPAAIAFVEQAAAAAEAANHHPDLDVRYTKVTVRFFTHDAKALTSRDTRLAAECEQKAARKS